MQVKSARLLDGKKGLITGVANNLSIAWAIAQIAREHGAELAFTYQGELLKKRVLPLVEEIGCDFVLPCDVMDEASIDHVFKLIEQKWGKLDFLVHAIAFSDKEELKGRYIDSTVGNFLNTMNVSCYSLTALSKRAEPLMKDAGSIVTLTYYGSQKAVPHYNAMGVAKSALESSVRYLAADMGPNNIRVNAISSGPIKTLASSAIGDFKTMYGMYENVAPLRRNVSQQEVAKSALYLLSDLSSGVTGEIHYVDCGYNITTGMPSEK